MRARVGAAPSVLMIGNRLNDAAASRPASCELSDRLEARGWRVVAASGKRNRGARMADMLWTTWRARRDYEVAQVDVFSFAAFRWAEAVTWTLRRLGKRTVLVLRGGNLPEFGLRHPRRMSRLLQRADLVITPSDYLRRAFSDVRPDIQVIPNAVDLTCHQAAVRSAPRARIVWIRAFHATYNPPMAVAVIALLRDTGVEATLVMAGPDKRDGTFEATRKAAAELAVESSVTFAGQLSKGDIPGLLGRSDIFINTTNVDNTPVTVIEALASGLCVVSTDVGGIRDLLTHERNALLVSPGDAEAMAQAIRRILSEPGLAARLSTEARRTAERFDWSNTVGQWERSLQA